LSHRSSTLLYGGYLTALALARNSDIFKAVRTALKRY